ncbi:hypothetical protein ACPJHQ_24570 [Rossellomorea sp. H39__3]
MSGIQRFHPAFLVVELVSFVKGIFFVYFFLFVLKAQSTSGWVVWEDTSSLPGRSGPS